VYWWNLFYYPDPVLIDYVYYWSGFFAWGLRSAAWRKIRLQGTEKRDRQSGLQAAIKLMGIVVIAIGLIVITFGSLGQKASEEFTSAYAFSEWLVLYLPYWPFEPFIPLFVILLGIFLATESRIVPKLVRSDSTVNS
jgi:hypothetical protein